MIVLFNVIEVRQKNHGIPNVKVRTYSDYEDSVKDFNDTISEPLFGNKEGYTISTASGSLSLPYYEKYDTELPSSDYFKCSIKEIKL